MRTRTYIIIAVHTDGNIAFEGRYRAASVAEAKAMCERECAGVVNAIAFKTPNQYLRRFRHV